MNRVLDRVGLAVLAVAGATGVQATILTNRYDFEKASGYVTEPGWTHTLQTTIYTSTTPGFSAGSSFYYFSPDDRGFSTQSPTAVTRDLVFGRGLGSLVTPTVVFRDIVPEGATNVSFKIYRSDPADNGTRNFQTWTSYNGGALTLIDAGSTSFGFYWTPIAGSQALAGRGTFDFYFFDPNVDSSDIRLNGIETIFDVTIPEPSTVLLLAVGGLMAWRKRQ